MSNELTAAISMAKEVQALIEFIQRIKDALNTEETGEALVEVARNSHKTELELAALKTALSSSLNESDVLEAVSEYLS